VNELERARPWDDDVAQTIILAEGLRSSGLLDIATLERELVRWQHENGRGIGSLTAEVIRAMRNASSPGEAAQQVWERGGRRAAGNGAVMRCAPVGLRWRRSPSDLIAQTRRSTVVTHYDPRCEWSAVALNAALARALADTPTDLAALAAALDAAEAPAEVGAAVRAVPGCTLDDLALDGPSMGYTLKAMQVGLWCLEQPPDFEDVLVAVIHAGGDTDTNGAVAGAIMGSRLGVGGIPHRWLANVRDTDRIVELADALFEAAEQS